MPDDSEIAKSYKMKLIEEIAERAGIPLGYLKKYGSHKAKILWPQEIKNLPERGKLVMVTAMTPTPAGEGKTTTAIGLADAFGHLQKSPPWVLCLGPKAVPREEDSLKWSLARISICISPETCTP